MTEARMSPQSGGAGKADGINYEFGYEKGFVY